MQDNAALQFRKILPCCPVNRGRREKYSQSARDSNFAWNAGIPQPALRTEKTGGIRQRAIVGELTACQVRRKKVWAAGHSLILGQGQDHDAVHLTIGCSWNLQNHTVGALSEFNWRTIQKVLRGTDRLLRGRQG
jgi:hypothetical protein